MTLVKTHYFGPFLIFGAFVLRKQYVSIQLTALPFSVQKMGKRPDMSLAMKRSWARYKNSCTLQTTEDLRWEAVRLFEFSHSRLHAMLSWACEEIDIEGSLAKI